MGATLPVGGARRRGVLYRIATGLVAGLAALASAAGAGPAAAPRSANPFGVMLAPRLASSDSGPSVARALGARYVRPEAVLTAAAGDPLCPSCDRFRQAGFELVLTVRNTDDPRQASRPPRDLQAYRRKVDTLLSRYRPALLVVENEENSSLFYAGTPEDYGVELRAACEVAARYQVPCTNGGLVGSLAALLVYAGYLDSGRPDRAEAFARRAFTGEERQQLGSPRVRRQLERGQQLLRLYPTAGLAAVNVHWYGEDPQALEEVVAYLRARSGLPVLTNEVGQHNLDPRQTTAVMAKVVELGLPVAVWFAQDGPRARGLVDGDGTLRATGLAFRKFIAERFGLPK